LYEKSYNKSSAVQLLLRWPRIRPLLHKSKSEKMGWDGQFSGKIRREARFRVHASYNAEKYL